MIFGYARVSTKEQNLNLQLDALRKYGIDEIHEEKVTGKSILNRPELDNLFSKLRTGDTFVVWRLDRLGRSSKQLLILMEQFEEKGINFVSLCEHFDTTTPMGKFCFTLFCAVAQMERDVISERTYAGLESARARGRVGGRKPINDKTVNRALIMYNTNQFSIQEILDITGMKKSTLYKYINMQNNKN